MDYELILLIGMIVATFAVGGRLGVWWSPARPRREYQRVFNAAAGGLLFLVAGIAGWDLRYSHGLFQGTKWVDGPLWWQVAAGTALLLLAGFWARRLLRSRAPR
jgi:hypothetical protein